MRLLLVVSYLAESASSGIKMLMNLIDKLIGKITLLLKKWFIIVLISLSVSQHSVAEQSSIESYQIKALFLYNFANFVEWPSNAFRNDHDPIMMCLFGDVPFGGFLDEVNGTKIGERELIIYRTTDIESIRRGCHILFVGEDQKVQLPSFWTEIQYVYVLSVGEEEGFTDRGGVVNIMRTTDQVLFEINISNAMVNGLFISSDVLSLAREIKSNNDADEGSQK